jgi:hypothetical protein
MTIIQKDKDPILDQKFFDLLFPIIFPVESQDPIIRDFVKLKLSIEMKLLSTGSLLEQAISSRKNLTRHATIGKDFVDGSDAKSASVRWASNGTTYGAPIHDIFNKKGLLRCVIYERLHDKFYFFLIPHKAYENISKTSNIEIPFNLDGTPRKNAKVRNVDWWQFEVTGFDGILSDVANDFEFAKEKKERLKREKAALQRPRKSKKSNIVSPTPDSAPLTKTDPTLQMSNLCSLETDRQQSLDFGDTLPISPCEISLSI